MESKGQSQAEGSNTNHQARQHEAENPPEGTMANSEAMNRNGACIPKTQNDDHPQHNAGQMNWFMGQNMPPGRGPPPARFGRNQNCFSTGFSRPPSFMSMYPPPPPPPPPPPHVLPWLQYAQSVASQSFNPYQQEGCQAHGMQPPAPSVDPSPPPPQQSQCQNCNGDKQWVHPGVLSLIGLWEYVATIQQFSHYHYWNEQFDNQQSHCRCNCSNDETDKPSATSRSITDSDYQNGNAPQSGQCCNSHAKSTECHHQTADNMPCQCPSYRHSRIQPGSDFPAPPHQHNPGYAPSPPLAQQSSMFQPSCRCRVPQNRPCCMGHHGSPTDVFAYNSMCASASSCCHHERRRNQQTRHSAPPGAGVFERFNSYDHPHVQPGFPMPFAHYPPHASPPPPPPPPPLPSHLNNANQQNSSCHCCRKPPVARYFPGCSWVPSNCGCPNSCHTCSHGSPPPRAPPPPPPPPHFAPQGYSQCTDNHRPGHVQQCLAQMDMSSQQVREPFRSQQGEFPMPHVESGQSKSCMPLPHNSHSIPPNHSTCSSEGDTQFAHRKRTISNTGSWKDVNRKPKPSVPIPKKSSNSLHTDRQRHLSKDKKGISADLKQGNFHENSQMLKANSKFPKDLCKVGAIERTKPENYNSKTNKVLQGSKCSSSVDKECSKVGVIDIVYSSQVDLSKVKRIPREAVKLPSSIKSSNVTTFSKNPQNPNAQEVDRVENRCTELQRSSLYLSLGDEDGETPIVGETKDKRRTEDMETEDKNLRTEDMETEDKMSIHTVTENKMIAEKTVTEVKMKTEEIKTEDKISTKKMENDDLHVSVSPQILLGATCKELTPVDNEPSNSDHECPVEVTVGELKLTSLNEEVDEVEIYNGAIKNTTLKNIELLRTETKSAEKDELSKDPFPPQQDVQIMKELGELEIGTSDSVIKDTKSENTHVDQSSDVVEDQTNGLVLDDNKDGVCRSKVSKVHLAKNIPFDTNVNVEESLPCDSESIKPHGEEVCCDIPPVKEDQGMDIKVMSIASPKKVVSVKKNSIGAMSKEVTHKLVAEVVLEETTEVILRKAPKNSSAPSSEEEVIDINKKEGTDRPSEPSVKPKDLQYGKKTGDDEIPEVLLTSTCKSAVQPEKNAESVQSLVFEKCVKVHLESAPEPLTCVKLDLEKDSEPLVHKSASEDHPESATESLPCINVHLESAQELLPCEDASLPLPTSGAHATQSKKLVIKEKEESLAEVDGTCEETKTNEATATESGVDLAIAAAAAEEDLGASGLNRQEASMKEEQFMFVCDGEIFPEKPAQTVYLNGADITLSPPPAVLEDESKDDENVDDKSKDENRVEKYRSSWTANKSVNRSSRVYVNPAKVGTLRYLILQSPLVMCDVDITDDEDSDPEKDENGEVIQDYPLGYLPTYIVAQIFSYLGTRDLAALKCTCKDFRWLIDRYNIRGNDSRWLESDGYKEDPCYQCGKIRDARGDVSLCRWHPKIYYKNGHIGRRYWTCCFALEEDAIGCQVGLHDNNWVLSGFKIRKVPRPWRNLFWRGFSSEMWW